MNQSQHSDSNPHAHVWCAEILGMTMPHQTQQHTMIREAEIEDADAIGELSGQLGYPTTTEQSANRLRVIFRSDEHFVLVACHNNSTVVGWIHVFLALRVESDGFAEMGGFVVDAQHRGTGIGKHLLEEAERRISHLGVQKLRVRTRSTRNDAHQFYQRLGFSKTKEQFVYDKRLDTKST